MPAPRQSSPSRPRPSRSKPAAPSSKSSPASPPDRSPPSDRDRYCFPPDRLSQAPPPHLPPASPVPATLRSQSSYCSTDYARTPPRAPPTTSDPLHPQKCNAPPPHPDPARQSIPDTSLETSRYSSSCRPILFSSPTRESKSARDISLPAPPHPEASSSSTYK